MGTPPAKAAAAKKTAEKKAEPVEEERFNMPSGPPLPAEAPVDYGVPEEWLIPEGGGWPAPLYRAPDLAGLQRLRAEFPANVIEKLPKNIIRNENARPENCKVCHGYHKPCSVHLDYIGHAVTTDRLNSVDPLWFWEPYADDPLTKLPLLDYDSQNRPVGMWIRLHVAGKTMLGYGSSDPKPDAVKEIIGDALRNAAMRMGVALSMWVKGEMESLSEHPEALGTGTGAVKAPDRDAAGQPVLTKGQRENLVAKFDSIPDGNRAAVKREFMAVFGIEKITRLTQDRLTEAIGWIEGEAADYSDDQGSEAPEEADGSSAQDPSEPDTAGGDVAIPDAGDPEPSPTEPPSPPAEPPSAPEPPEPAEEAPAPRLKPGDGEEAWEGELTAHPSTGEVLFAPADYIEGIVAFAGGMTKDQTQRFDEWRLARWWVDGWETFPQWALVVAFNKLSAIVEGTDTQGAADG